MPRPGAFAGAGTPMAVRGGKWAGVPAAALLLVGVALVAVKAPWRGGRDESMQNADLQQVQSLEVANGEWEVPGTEADDETEVAAGHKALNRGRINWYWIPPKAEPYPGGLPRRLDASGAVAGDPRSSKAGLSPLVLDHVFTSDNGDYNEGKKRTYQYGGNQMWANVHAFDHGELLTGQMRLVHPPPRPPPPPPPEKHVDLDGVLHGVVEEAIASAYAEVMSQAPPPPQQQPPLPPPATPPPPPPAEDARKKLEPIKNPPTHLPWEVTFEESEESNEASTSTATIPVESTPPLTTTPTTTPAPVPTEEEVSEAIAEAVEKKEEETNIKVVASLLKRGGREGGRESVCLCMHSG